MTDTASYLKDFFNTTDDGLTDGLDELGRDGVLAISSFSKKDGVYNANNDMDSSDGSQDLIDQTMSYPVIQYPSKEDYSVPQWNTNMLVAFSGLDSLGEGSTFIEEMQQHESATQRSSHSGDDDDGQSAEGTPFDEDEAFNQFMQFGTVKAPQILPTPRCFRVSTRSPPSSAGFPSLDCIATQSSLSHKRKRNSEEYVGEDRAEKRFSGTEYASHGHYRTTSLHRHHSSSSKASGQAFHPLLKSAPHRHSAPPAPYKSGPMSSNSSSSNGLSVSPKEGTSKLPRTITIFTPKKRRLACLFCRQRKISCDGPTPDDPDKACGQCTRRNLACTYPEPAKRNPTVPLESFIKIKDRF